MSCEQNAPRISIVTPSFGPDALLEATVRSVLDQNYPNLEYIVMLGGSTDVSAEIIKKYQDRITYRISQQIGGQNQAITDGFKHATGEIYAYLTPGDIYWTWSFRTVARLFALFPQIQWLTSQTLMVLNAHGIPANAMPAEQYARTRFFRGVATPHDGNRSGLIQQAATFWRRDLWDKTGGHLDPTTPLAADLDLWARFFQHADLVTTDIPLAGSHYRNNHQTQKSREKYLEDCRAILRRYPDKRLVNPLRLGLARQLFKWTGRGGQRWGSMIQWIRYNQHQKRWVFHSRYVF
ncbi:MAG: glycosyltransferase [Anaerolineae bacterium]|nr:glycosyltransferase [Anaerolineae bacterium]